MVTRIASAAPLLAVPAPAARAARIVGKNMQRAATGMLGLSGERMS